MIDGVTVKQLVSHQDDPDTDGPVQPGFLVEVLRDDDEILNRFGQSTFTVAYHGTIKAFHWHKKQDDLWFVASGKALVVLYDQRPDSPTFGQTVTMTAGQDDFKLIVIPAGVVHGYAVLSEEPVMLFYHTTEHYDPQNPDEQRIPHNDPTINFDWEGAVRRTA